MQDEHLSKTELARERTYWAEDRTILASERTFAAWMRTGLSSVAVGLAVQAIFYESQPTWLAKLGATLFVIIGIVVFMFAFRSARYVLSRLESQSTNPVSKTGMSLIAILFVLASLFLDVILWTL